MPNHGDVMLQRDSSGQTNANLLYSPTCFPGRVCIYYSESTHYAELGKYSRRRTGVRVRYAAGRRDQPSFVQLYSGRNAALRNRNHLLGQFRPHRVSSKERELNILNANSEGGSKMSFRELCYIITTAAAAALLNRLKHIRFQLRLIVETPTSRHGKSF